MFAKSAFVVFGTLRVNMIKLKVHMWLFLQAVIAKKGTLWTSILDLMQNHEKSH